MIILRPYQAEAKKQVFSAWASNYNNVLLVMPTGGGKCFAASTPILLHNGLIVRADEVMKGDKLMGPDSLPRVVTSTCKGRSEMYKITPVKGDSWVCNDVHMLTLKHTENKSIIDIPLNEYLEKSKNFKHLYKQFRTGVKFPKKKVEFDPYFVGLYLAEGSKRCNLSSLSKLRRETCPEGNDRNIPKRYKINSRENRLKLLAGLLDGDGYLHNNYYEIITKYKQLRDDILYLCRSLGMAAYSSIKIGRIKSLGFEGEYHRITISGHLDYIPCKVKRKQATPRKQIKDVLNTGFKVEPIGEGDYYGFTLDDSDCRFLLGDFTVTHNTKTFCDLVIDTLNDQEVSLPTAIIVHRKELVQQICLTLAEEGIPHNIIASTPTIKGIIAAERRMFGKQYYNANSIVTVISVDTLNARHDRYKKWCEQIKQWIVDEAAHVLKDNKWGKAVSYFKNARGLGVTATPERLDRKGLGSHADGVFDIMVEGPPTRWMIDNGFLSKYKIAIPDSDYHRYLQSSSNTSDYSKKAMTEASNKSQIVGDVVDNYIKHAKGKQAILFASDVATAKRMEKQFLDKGIVAKSLDGTTPDAQRLDSLIKFREKKIQVLVNVDLFDEGLDVPGIECVIMARPTKSLGKYLQMIGRGLRVADGKPYLILIDHVGNVLEHLLPCNIRRWTLDRIKKTGKKLNFLRICSNFNCNAPYDRALTECPWCGEPAIKANNGGGGGRVPPAMVDGDLTLIDPETLRELQGMSKLEDPGFVGDRVGNAINAGAGLRAMKNQSERVKMQKTLSDGIAAWAGKMRHHYGYTDRMIHKKFYLYQGMTISEALGEPKADMERTLDDIDGGF